MNKIEKAVQFILDVAKNDKDHGYDQRYRWGEKGDYDCSSLVITAFQNAGVPVKTAGATYTGNMRPVFLKNGFKDITKSVNLKTGVGLKRGDVLLNTALHTAVYLGNGKLVHARLNEKEKVTDGKTGDQTGKEIMVGKYYNRPWNVILRYIAEDEEDEVVEKREFIVNGKKEKLDTIVKDGFQYVKLQELQRVGILNAIWDAVKKTTTLK